MLRDVPNPSVRRAADILCLGPQRFGRNLDADNVARCLVSALSRALPRRPSKSSEHCSENTIPQPRGDTVVSGRKLVMVEVMLQQGSRDKCRIVMGAIVDK